MRGLRVDDKAVGYGLRGWSTLQVSNRIIEL